MSQFPSESKEYRQARNDLLDLELQARRAVEAAARARRELPLGGQVTEDYVFQECDAGGNVREVQAFATLYAALTNSSCL